MMKTDRRVLITGAAKRVGRAMALAFHRAGYRVAVHYRRSETEAEQLVAKLNETRPASAFSVAADLNQSGDIDALAAAIDARWEGLDCLINNASDFYPTPVGEIMAQDWHRLQASNGLGPLLLTQGLRDMLRSSGGNVINITDIHANRPMPGHTVYCMAKAGLVMATKSLALELAPEIRVNAIAPGAILWPPDASEAQKRQTLEKVPLGRVGSSDDIAQAALYLAEAAYVTGHILNVDGGRSVVS